MMMMAGKVLISPFISIAFFLSPQLQLSSSYELEKERRLLLGYIKKYDFITHLSLSFFTFCAPPYELN